MYGCFPEIESRTNFEQNGFIGEGGPPRTRIELNDSIHKTYQTLVWVISVINCGVNEV